MTKKLKVWKVDEDLFDYTPVSFFLPGKWYWRMEGTCLETMATSLEEVLDSTHGPFDSEEEALKDSKLFRAREFIDKAVADLGTDLDGGSRADLLLDNMIDLKDSAEAHSLLKELGEE